MVNPKRVLTADEQFRLRNELQLSTLAALMESRRWEPGDLVFQGGTCLHLAHGSARFSEDLDFMIRGGLSVEGLANEIKRRVRLPTSADDLAVSVATGRHDRNPHSFTVTLSAPHVIGSVKVKVELWETDSTVLRAVQVVVSTIAGAGRQTYVPSENLDEIHADKVFAVGARARLKPRDVFDLWWLHQRSTPPVLLPDSLLARLRIHPGPENDPRKTAARWLANAAGPLAELAAPDTPAKVAVDLKRWLPSSWPMEQAHAADMLAIAAVQLEKGMAVVRDFEAGGEKPALAKQG